jgi:hypothetical protein
MLGQNDDIPHLVLYVDGVVPLARQKVKRFFVHANIGKNHAAYLMT